MIIDRLPLKFQVLDFKDYFINSNYILTYVYFYYKYSNEKRIEFGYSISHKATYNYERELKKVLRTIDENCISFYIEKGDPLKYNKSLIELRIIKIISEVSKKILDDKKIISELEMLRSILYQKYFKKVTGFIESVVK